MIQEEQKLKLKRKSARSKNIGIILLKILHVVHAGLLKWLVVSVQVPLLNVLPTKQN